MAVGFGLLAALLWGLADFMIRRSGRTVGIHRSMLYAQGFGAVSVGAWILGSPETGTVVAKAPVLAWVAALGAAPIGLAGTMSLYRGLKVGRMGLVSPIAGAYGAVTAVLAVVAGEPISRLALAGIVALAAGAVLAAAQPDDVATGRPTRTGLFWAGAACLCFGLQFWIQGRFAVPGLGAVLPVGIYYLVATLTLGAAAVVRRPPLALSGANARTVLMTGMVAVAGYVVFSIGLGTGNVAVVTVLSSLQSTVAVALASVFLRERLTVHQWIGVALVALGLGLVRAG